MQDSITTNININVLNSLDVPATGFLTERGSDGGMVAPIVALSIVIIIAALLAVHFIRKRRVPKLRSPFSKKLNKFARIFGVVFALFGVAVVSLMSRSVNAVESLITISLNEQPAAIDAVRGTQTSNVAQLAIAMATESRNDLTLEVDFESKNPGIELSSTSVDVVLPGGTTTATVPISVSVADSVEIGNYIEEVEITVSIKEGFWRADGRDVVNPQGMATLLKGMNISTAVAVFYDDSMPAIQRLRVENNDFTYAELETMGINAVRFDIPARVFADSCTNAACLTYDYTEEVFEIFDDILADAANHNIGVIFNIHNSYGTSHPRDGSGPAYSKWDTFLPENIEKTTALWEKIATRFVNDNRVLGFDIMNEPMIRLENGETASDAIAKWDTAAQSMIDRIRAIDENHMIVVEKANRALSNNGNSEVGLGSSYVFADVTDPQENLMHQFHSYGNWSYVTQSDNEVNNDPWVWPTTGFMGVIKDFSSVNSGGEVWPPARFTGGTDASDTWVTVESNNGAPAAIAVTDPKRNLGNVSLVTSGTLNADSAYYVDSIVVEQYSADGVFEKNVYEQSFKFSGVYPTNVNGTTITDSSLCSDNVGGCYKIFGPTTGSVGFATAWEKRRFFPADASKKYKVTAKIYGENIPVGASMRVMLSFSYGSEEQVRPYDKSYLQAVTQKYIDYAEENNVPIFNGEYGVLKNGEVWDKIGAAQFVSDSLEVYEENYVNAAYFAYYNRNSNSVERRAGVRVREYATNVNLLIDGTESVLNQTLYDVFIDHK